MQEEPESSPTAREILKELSLRPEETSALESALGSREGEPKFAERLEGLAGLALREYLLWITGRRRFNSIPESDGTRVRSIFLELRGEPPTVEQLVDGFGFSEPRATSLLSRLRYGDARKLRVLAYAAAAKTIEASQASASEEDGRKTLYLPRDVWDIANEASWHIMSQPEKQAKAGEYEGAEWPEASVTRYGCTVRASSAMWNHVVRWLEQAGTTS
jgi:hypothetical protein